MQILALDVASNCGFAHSSGDSGTWKLSPKAGESKGLRLVRFRSKLKELLSQKQIDVVVFEGAISFGRAHANGMLVQSEMQGVLKLWCEDNGIRYVSFSPAEIKKHATGKGNADKVKMLTAAKRAFAVPVYDDNQADALWLLDLAQKTLS